jgi:hypothetical protein
MLKILQVIVTSCCCQSASSLFPPAFLIGFRPAPAIATVLVFARIRAAPDENPSHGQHKAKGEKLLPVHASNITANRCRAN